MEKRYLNISFSKGGSGSISTRVSIPKNWVDKMEITNQEPEITATFDGETITIHKLTLQDQLERHLLRLIEEQVNTYGRTGSESVSVSMTLTDEEKEAFFNIEEFERPNYSWNFSEKTPNKLHLSYVEETFDRDSIYEKLEERIALLIKKEVENADKDDDGDVDIDITIQLTEIEKDFFDSDETCNKYSSNGYWYVLNDDMNLCINYVGKPSMYKVNLQK